MDSMMDLIFSKKMYPNESSESDERFQDESSEIRTNSSINSIYKSCTSKFSIMRFAAQRNVHSMQKEAIKANLPRLLKKRNQELNICANFGGESVKFNHHMLQSYSQLIANIPWSDVTKVEFRADKTLTPEGFRLLCEWLQEDMNVLKRNFVEFVNAAAFLEVKIIGDFINELLKNLKTLFTEPTMISLFAEAAIHDNEEIAMAMLSNISCTFLMFVTTREFLQLPVNYVRHLLRLDNIAVYSEEEVLQSVLRWLMWDLDNRFIYVIPLMDCVRFSFFSLSKLVNLRKGLFMDSTAFREIFTLPSVQQMIDEGFVDALVKYEGSSLVCPEVYLEKHQHLGSKRKKRVWIDEQYFETI